MAVLVAQLRPYDDDGADSPEQAPATLEDVRRDVKCPPVRMSAPRIGAKFLTDPEKESPPAQDGEQRVEHAEWMRTHQPGAIGIAEAMPEGSHRCRVRRERVTEVDQRLVVRKIYELDTIGHSERGWIEIGAHTTEDYEALEVSAHLGDEEWERPIGAKFRPEPLVDLVRIDDEPHCYRRGPAGGIGPSLRTRRGLRDALVPERATVAKAGYDTQLPPRPKGLPRFSVIAPPSRNEFRLGLREGALAPYLGAIRAHRLVFASIVVAALAAASLWLWTSSRQYSATAQVLVTPLPQDNQSFLGFDLLRDSGDPTRTVQTAAALIETRAAADRAAKRLGDGRSGEQIAAAVSVQAAGESNVLDITATGDSPRNASRTANAFTAAALALRRETLHAQLEEAIKQLQTSRAQGPERNRRFDALRTLDEQGDPTMSVAQRALPADSPLGPSPVIVIGLALLAGLAIGTGAVVLLEMTASRIRDEEEAVHLYPLPVLARSPILGESGRRRRNMDSLSMQPSAREPFRTLMAQLQREGEGHVVMLTSASTGDGKTTSSVNLALTAALGGHSTILVDADFRKPGVGEALQLDVGDVRPSVFVDPGAIEASLVEVPGVDELRVLTPGTPDSQAEALVERFSERLPATLERASALAEYVIVDTAPLGEIGDALRVTPHVNDIIVVVYPGNTNRANFEIMRDLLERTDDRPTGLLVIGDRTGASYSYYGYGVNRHRGGLPNLAIRHRV